MAENEGSEKTERATPKRLEEARKKGQVPRSADLSAAIVSLIGAGFLYLFGAGAANEMLSVMRDGLSVTSVDLMQSDVLLRHTADQFVHGFLAVVPLMGVLVLAGDGAVMVEVEAIEVTLHDVTRPYVAPSQKKPEHRE